MTRPVFPIILLGGGFSFTLMALFAPWGGYHYVSFFGPDSALRIYPWGFQEMISGVFVSRGWLGEHAAETFGTYVNVSRGAFLGYLLALGAAALAFAISLRRNSSDADVAFVGLIAASFIVISGTLVVMGAHQAFGTQEYMEGATVASVVDWSAGIFMAFIAVIALGAAGVMLLKRTDKIPEDPTVARHPQTPNTKAQPSSMKTVPIVVCPTCQADVPVLAGKWPLCLECGFGERRETA